MKIATYEEWKAGVLADVAELEGSEAGDEIVFCATCDGSGYSGECPCCGQEEKCKGCKGLGMVTASHPAAADVSETMFVHCVVSDLMALSATLHGDPWKLVHESGLTVEKADPKRYRLTNADDAFLVTVHPWMPRAFVMPQLIREGATAQQLLERSKQ